MDITGLTGRIAAAIGGSAIGVVAARGLARRSDHTYESRTAQIQALDSTAEREWTEFRTALEAEFPAYEVYSREDHARLDRFLRDHPAPTWITVEHEGFSRIHLSTTGYLPDSLWRPIQEESDYPYAIGTMTALGGAGFAAVSVLRPPTHNAWGAAGAIAGAAALAGVGVAIFADGRNTSQFRAQAFRREDAVMAEVNAHA